MDGQVLKDIYEPDFFASRSLAYKDLEGNLVRKKEDDEAYSAAEEESIKDALKNLGYLG